MLPSVIQRVRRLLRRPELTVPAVASLALGSAGVVTMMTLIHAVVIAPLPYASPDELVYVGWRFSAAHTSAPAGVSRAMADHVVENAAQFRDLARYTEGGTVHALTTGDAPAERVIGVRADDGLIRTAGVSPVAGRNFTPDEAGSGAAVVLVGERTASRLFGSPRNAVGEDLTLDGIRRQVVGVLPADFKWHGPIDVVVPLGPAGGAFDQGHNTSLVGRLEAGATLAAAQAEVASLAQAFDDSRGVEAPNDAWGPWLAPYKELIVGDTDEPLRLLLAAVALLMLLACLNTANLVLADAAASRGDAAVRLALGARRGNLHAGRFLDCLLLAFAGLAAGLGAAHFALPLIVTGGPAWLGNTLNEVAISGWVVAWMVPVALLAAAVCAALAAIGGQVVDLSQTLRSAATGRGAGRAPLRKFLVITQIAASFVLLVGAAMVGSSVQRLMGAELGFRVDGVHAAQVSLVDARYRGERSSAETSAFLARVVERVAAAPGVAAVAASSSLPLERGLNNYLTVPGRDDGYSVQARIVTPGYFETLEVPLLAGRGLAWSDGASAEPVLVVNRAFADRILDGDPVDAFVSLDGREWRIVGVAGDQREISLRSDATPTVFLTYAQTGPALLAAVNRWFPTAIMSRGPVAPDIRSLLAEMAPEIPLLRMRELRSVVTESVPLERFVGTLLAAFGVCALALSLTGLFGLLEFERVRRRHELAVRLALGARPAQVRGLVLRRGAAWVGAGLAVGALGGIPAVRFIEKLLHQPGVGDLGVLSALAVGVLFVALAAASVSAGRAARIEPSAALRHE